MIEDVFKVNKGKVGIVIYSVTGKKMMNGKPVTLSEGVLVTNANLDFADLHTTEARGTPVVLWMDPGGYDAYRVNRRSEVDKAVRSLLRQHAAKGDDPQACSFYIVKEDGDIALCSMAYNPKDRGTIS